MVAFTVIVSILALLTSRVCATASQFGNLKNLEIIQNVDLSAPYLKRSFKIKVENIGQDAVTAYYLPLPLEDVPKLSALEAHTFDGEPMIVTAEPVTQLSVDADEQYAIYKIEFDEDRPLGAGESTEFEYGLVTIGALKPLPLKAAQLDTQMMFYDGSKTTVSLYKSDLQETNIGVVTSKVVDLVTGQSVNQDSTAGSKLTFGPFKNVPPLKKVTLKLQYENPLMMPRFPHLNRTIWVSHWGSSVSFDESYDLLNDGTQLSKPFSRLDFTKMQTGFNLNSAAIRHLRLRLSSQHTREEYYVDLVGNVSTSAASPGTLDIMPRYPVMGGWRYNFTVGWADDLSEYVHSPASNSYILKVPLIGGPETPASYDSVESTIVLPEGATDIEVYDSFGLEPVRSVTYNYLDLFGRPTVTLKYRNLIDSHKRGSIFVSYNYSVLTALRKPLAYAAAIFALFMSSFWLFF